MKIFYSMDDMIIKCRDTRNGLLIEVRFHVKFTDHYLFRNKTATKKAPINNSNPHFTVSFC